MKVLIHAGLCGPLLSDAAVLRLRELGWSPEPNDPEAMKIQGETQDGVLLDSSWNPLDSEHGERHDPLVLQVFEEMGQDMFTAKQEALENGWGWPPKKSKDYPGTVHAVEIPDGTEYEIYQFEGGWEHIHEKHRIWRISI